MLEFCFQVACSHYEEYIIATPDQTMKAAKSTQLPIEQTVILCPSCDLLVSKQNLSTKVRAICPRCDTFLFDTPYCSLNGMLAICISAIAMLIPANYLPIIEMHFLGSIRATTLFQSAVTVIEQGYWFVGIAVIVASTIAPAILIFSILAQILLVKRGLKKKWHRNVFISLLSFQKLLTELTMLEIYLLSLLVTAFQLSDFADVQFNQGTFCFVMLFLSTLFLLREYNLAHMWTYLDE